MLKKITAIFVLAIMTTQVHARGVDLRLADETAEVIYLTESSTFGYGGADVGLGLFFNEADDFMLSAEAMVAGHSAGNNRPLQFGVGGKLMFASLDLPDEEAGALAVGGQIRYVIPSTTPVAFLAQGFFAPSITSFSDADGYTEFRLAVELEVTPSARAYLGWRNMEYELESGADIEMDDDIHFGVKLEF